MSRAAGLGYPALRCVWLLLQVVVIGRAMPSGPQVRCPDATRDFVLFLQVLRWVTRLVKLSDRLLVAVER